MATGSQLNHRAARESNNISFRSLNACLAFLGFEGAYHRHSQKSYHPRTTLRSRYNSDELKYELKRLFREKAKTATNDEELRMVIEAYKRGQHILGET